MARPNSVSELVGVVAALSIVVVGPVAAARAGAGGPVAVDQRLWSSSGVAVNQTLWGADGKVLASVRSGSTLYIAGTFRSVGSNSGGVAVVDRRSGTIRGQFPRVTGAADNLTPDGEGGWFLGGSFGAVAGLPRSCLAHVLSDGAVSSWAPRIEAGHGVTSMVLEGGVLYVGGTFLTVDGLRRRHLAAFSAATGELLPWNPDADDWVACLVAHGRTIYAGGDFNSAGGQPRSHIAAIDAASGRVLDWNPGADGGVRALAVRDNNVYVGGWFNYLGGAERNLIGAVDARTGCATGWNPNVSGPSGVYQHIDGMAVWGHTVYASGQFDHVGAQVRGTVAAIDARTGEATAWSPDFGPRSGGMSPVGHTVAVYDGTVYVSGAFETVDDQSRPYLAAFDAVSGCLTDWNPRPNSDPSEIVVQGDAVVLGGGFTMIGDWRHRAGIAALDLNTGQVKPWNPNPDGRLINAIAVGDGVVYAAGDFMSIGGEARRYIAALDTINGEATPWNPGANGMPLTLLVSGSTLYAGGYFTTIGGQPRNYLAAVEASTGIVAPWNPNAGFYVFCLALSGDKLYVGGFFDYMGGQRRRALAAVDAATGAVLPWDAKIDYNWVNAIAVSGNRVYVGGTFDQIGGRARSALAELDGETALAGDWDAKLEAWDSNYPTVRALTLCGSKLVVGGDFATDEGGLHNFAIVDTATGEADPWDAGVNGYVWSLASYGNAVFAGGAFTEFGGFPCTGMASFTLANGGGDVFSRSSAIRSIALSLAPNPVRSDAKISFTLARAGSVELAVFDVEGRRVADILRAMLQPAGPHELVVSTEGWPQGCYFCRLVSGEGVATSKLLVMH